MKAVLKLRIEVFRVAIPKYHVCLCDEKMSPCPWPWKCWSDQIINILVLTASRLYSWRTGEQSSDEAGNRIRNKQVRYFWYQKCEEQQYRCEFPLPSAFSFQVSNIPKSGVEDIFGLTETILGGGNRRKERKWVLLELLQNYAGIAYIMAGYWRIIQLWEISVHILKQDAIFEHAIYRRIS